MGKVTKSPAGFFMKALKEGWTVSDAEREMVQVQQSLIEREQQETEAKAQAQNRMALQAAAQEVSAQERMGDEVRQGWEAYEEAAHEQRDEWRRNYKRSPAAKLTMRRLSIDPMADMNDASLSDHEALRTAFSLYVFMQTKAARTKGA